MARAANAARSYLNRSIFLLDVASAQTQPSWICLAALRIDHLFAGERCCSLECDCRRALDLFAERDLATRATQMQLVDAQAHQLLAAIENKETGKLDLMQMRLAAHTGPPNWPIEKRYIQLLAETGTDKAAIDELLSCLQSQWYRADSWKLLSDLHIRLGHSSQAAEALAQARAFDVHLETSGQSNL